MVFWVESGYGTPGANAYATVQFVTDYLTDRGRVTENLWSTIGTASQKTAIVRATDYIETRWGPLFKGWRALTDIPGRQASALVALTLLPQLSETLTIGQKVYRMVDTLVQENDVLRGATIAQSIANLVTALEGSALGVTTEGHTLPNYEAMGIDQSPDLAIAARMAGESGNAIALSTTITGATTSATTLEDGLDNGPQPLSFPRRGLYTRDGQFLYGVPLKIRQATAEYAVRALSSLLAPDPTYDAGGVTVLSRSVSVGPVSKSTTYAQGSSVVIRAYPAADRLLAEFANVNGSVYR